MWRCLDVLKDFLGDLARKNDDGDGGVECTGGESIPCFGNINSVSILIFPTQ